MLKDERPLYRKFQVIRDDPKRKHENCFYFVLDVDHDEHAIAALKAYAADCAQTRPTLSRDLEAIIRMAEIKFRASHPEKQP